MVDVYNEINDYNPKSKWKILIMLDDMINDINANEKFQVIIKDLFFRCRKSIIFIAKCYFSVPKQVRLNYTHY